MTAPTDLPASACHNCGFSPVRAIPGYSRFHRVTSDCKPWPAGGGLAICPRCGVAQAMLDPAWHADAAKIYSGYAPYHQSGGVEQNVFDAASGAATTRSGRLVLRLKTAVSLPEQGRLLDIGCGNGALLRAFGATFTPWTMAGLEVHEHLRPVVESIEHVERLYTGPLAEVPGQFSLISLIHVLEHIPAPSDFLAQLKDKLAPDGLLLIQVPDCEQNPFMLLVADHSSHFFLHALRRVVGNAGFEIVVAANDWVAKELTVVARKIQRPASFSPAGDQCDRDAAHLARNLEWLDRLAAHARELCTERPFGIFGTSIAATWLFGELGGAVDFFVDEDPNRPGKTCLDRPILDPAGIPAGARVLIALAPIIANGIRQRMEAAGFNARFHSPDPLPATSDAGSPILPPA